MPKEKMLNTGKNATEVEKYATAFAQAIEQVIMDRSSPLYLGLPKDLSGMFHAMATVAPNFMLSYLPEKHLSNLEFNHLAKELILQFDGIDENPAVSQTTKK